MSGILFDPLDNAVELHKPADLKEVRELITIYLQELDESASKVHKLYKAVQAERCENVDDAEGYADLIVQAIQLRMDVTGLLELDEALTDFLPADDDDSV